MLCQNCGKNEANVRYTQIINGVKKEIRLCDKCARELGIGSFEFNMPINFSSFLGDFFGDTSIDMLPSFVKENHKQCNTCGESYDEFVKTGLLGCPDCYDVFSDRLDPILKKLQGSSKHIGRGSKGTNNKVDNISNNDKPKVEEKVEDEKTVKLNKLNEDLKQAIKEERYEDAAKIRDEIKNIEKGNDKNV